MVRAATSLVACVFLLAATPAICQDYQRGLQNYRAVITGTKKLSDLSSQEQQEVFSVARLIARQAPSNASSECKSARSTAESRRQDLSDTARRLMRCADDSDLTDDCESELRRARSAQDDFASAASEVESHCRR